MAHEGGAVERLTELQGRYELLMDELQHFAAERADHLRMIAGFEEDLRAMRAALCTECLPGVEQILGGLVW